MTKNIRNQKPKTLRSLIKCCELKQRRKLEKFHFSRFSKDQSITISEPNCELWRMDYMREKFFSDFLFLIDKHHYSE